MEKDTLTFQTRDEFNAAVREAMVLGGDALKSIVDNHLRPLTEKQVAAMEEMLAKANRAIQTSPVGHLFARCIRALALAGTEVNKDPERAVFAAKKFFGADDPSVKALSDGLKLKATASQATDPSSLGNMIAPQVAREFIQLLRNKAVIRRIARVIPMPGGQITFRKQTSAGTAYWVGEGKPITASKPATGNLNLIRKKLGVVYVISNDLLRYAGPEVDALVLEDMVAISALAEDISCLRGDGTQYTPRGLASLIAAGNQFAQSAATLAGIDTDYAQAKRLLEEANIPFTDDELHWIMAPRTYWGLWNAKPGTDAGARPYRDELKNITKGEDDGRLLGAHVQKSNQVPKNLGGGSDSEVYLVHGPSAIIGDTLNNQVDIFPGGAYTDGGVAVSGISQDETVIRLLREMDFGLRYDTAASRITGVTIA